MEHESGLFDEIHHRYGPDNVEGQFSPSLLYPSPACTSEPAVQAHAKGNELLSPSLPSMLRLGLAHHAITLTPPFLFVCVFRFRINFPKP